MNTASSIRLTIAIILLWLQPSFASVVTSHSLVVATEAAINGTLDQDSNTTNSGSLNSSIATGVGQSSSNATWNYGGDVLTGSGSLRAERSTFFGFGFFNNTSLLTLQFTLNQTSSYQLQGNWGFQGVSGGNDSMTIRLRDSGGTTLFTDSLTTNGTSNFNSLGTLTTGDYALEFTATMDQFNFLGFSQWNGSWEVTEFRLTSTPEPGTLGASVMILLFIAGHRQRFYTGSTPCVPGSSVR